ncbi:MAG: YHYH protein [Gammaproteobacteria bacterium]|nr:YHYH protein [Gammaproteobacteria bacterium]
MVLYACSDNDPEADNTDLEGSTDSAGTTDSATDGSTDGSTDGTTDSSTDGTTDGSTEGTTDGIEPGNTVSTEGVICDYVNSTYNDSASVDATSNSEWTCSESERLLTANGLPDHPVGEFPNPANPNTIAEQAVSASYTLTPQLTDSATQLGGPAGTVGFILNGIKIDAGTGGSCNDTGDTCSLGGNVGSWSIEALTQSYFDFGTDTNNAHVQPGGSYHYHGMPEGFIEKQGGGPTTMTLIGWAADGFPIYARYGYTDANDANSPLTIMTGSYQLVSNVPSNRPATDLYELGTFLQDWEYVAGSGDLDECNGRTGVTPEFPAGIYHYYATDTYPYLIRCVKGEVEGGGPPPQP